MAKLAKINPLSGPWRDNIVAEIARSTVEKPLCKEAKICKEAKKAKDQSCATCDWAKHFQKSPTGRLLRGTIGWCSCKVDWPDMPFFFAPSQSNYTVPQMGGHGVHSDCWGRGISPNDGKDCKCYLCTLNAGV
jgi:hypothetical protein